jgi:hypothetical protein
MGQRTVKSFNACAGWALLCGLFLALGVSGCHRHIQPQGRWKLTLHTLPAVPASGQPTRFILHVARWHGQPLMAASAQLSLRMSFMDMGTQVIQLASQGGGNYAGEGQFSMGGDWDCRVQVQYQHVQKSRTFHYKVE